MPVNKDARRGTWYVHLHYKDASGTRRRAVKRGFRTESEAHEWELEKKKAVATPNEKSGPCFHKNAYGGLDALAGITDVG